MIGKKFAHYQVVEKLGEGGMGVVYKAEDTRLERTVALKVLPSDAVENAEDKARFAAEAKAAAALDHPNICTIYEFNEFDGQQYIAMAFIDGVSLKEKLAERPLAIDALLKIAVQIARGLDAAHEKGIVHRDIKSANVMITPRGRAKITDFGLAARAEAAQTDDEGSTLGTVAYSSPEQLTGSPLDARTDIWSFGVTLYEMTTGRLPFRGDYEQAIVYSILNETPEPVTGLRTGVPVELERIINKALAKNAGERYQTVDEMLFDLKSLRDDLDPHRSGAVSSTATRPVYGREPSLFQKMLDRHVFQVLAVYVAAAWGVTKLCGWIVDEFVLSPHWTGIVTVALACLVPTVFLLAYHRGGRAGAGWTRVERVGIPVNLVLAAAVLVFVFQGKDIGAATTRVAVENEEGQTIERVVPKSEFRKKLAFYVFDNASGDSTQAWLQYAVPLLLEYDMIQDQFLDVSSAFDIDAYEKLESAGFDDWSSAPLALKRKIARESHLDFFLVGSARMDGSDYVVDVRLHDTRSGKVVAENSIRGANLFTLCDELSVRIKHDMDVPDGYLEEATDLALEEMLTGSVQAARWMAEAMVAIHFQQDWRRGIDLLQSAVEEDSTLAYAHFTMAQSYLQSARSEEGLAAYEAAMRYVYKMPERMQFIVKANYYFFKQQPDNAFAVLKMMVELYPTDVFGHMGLAQIYMYKNEIDKAIAEYEKVIELDPTQYDHLHTVAGLAVRKGDNERALRYLEKFAEHNPRNPDSFIELGRFYERTGDYPGARRNYEKALLIDPGRVSVLTDLADIDNKQGRSDAALAQYREVLEKARTPGDRIRGLRSLGRYFVKHGRIEEGIEQIERAQEVEASALSPLMAQMRRVSDAELYATAGRPDDAFAVMEAIEKEITPPFDKIASLGYALIHIELEQADEAENSLAGFEEYMKQFRLELLRETSYNVRGRIAELRGDYEAAIADFLRRLELAPSETGAYRDIGRCYRKLGQYDEARENLLEMLSVFPFDPETNYELALVYQATGDGAKAAEHLRRALRVWKDADPGYAPAREARETAARLSIIQ